MAEVEKIRRHCDPDKKDAVRMERNGHYSNSPAHSQRGNYWRMYYQMPEEFQDLGSRSLVNMMSLWQEKG